MHAHSLRRVAVAMIFATSHVSIASAQEVPDSVRPGQIKKSFETLPEPRQVPEGISLELPMIEAPANAEQIRFTLNDLQLNGATVFAANELLSPLQSQIGTEVSLGDIYAITQRLTAHYRNAGYILSQVYVPAQTIEDGRVTLEVVEGFISDVRFQGKISGRQAMLSRMGEKIKAAKPLRAGVLERYLLLMNDLPGMIAQGTLRASPDTPGASELIVTLTQDWVDLVIDGNNRASSLLGPEQLGASLVFNSVLGLQEQTTFSYIQSTNSEQLNYAAVSHSHQFGANGLKVTLAASTNDSTPELGDDFQAFNLETGSDDFAIRFDYPILRSRAANAYVFASLTHHDGETSSDFSTEQSADKISAVRLGVSLDKVDHFGGVNLLEVAYSKGIDAFGASEFGDPLASRPGGDPEFSKATIYAARLQRLAPGWSALIALQAQKSFDNLLSPEEFAFGGANFGRAYDPSELVGDDGFAAKLELRYTRQAASGSGATIYTFYDFGVVEKDLANGEVVTDPDGTIRGDRDSAEAAGLGVRFNIGRNITGYIEGAVPLTNIVAAEGNDDPRVFGGIRVEF